MAKSTKELARELGFIRKRSSSSRNNKEIPKPKQLFAYLVVLDFESTCWKDARHRTQEIIEFPAVLLNTATGQIESEFQFYVQPQECPMLSDFCRELTGITQDQVDEGIPLGIVLRKFSTWLRKNSEEYNFRYNLASEDDFKLCTFVTWSDWDLGVCLLYEARRKQLRKPAELCSWIDLRATYRKFYERTPKGLNGALQDLGLGFQGREHSGLDDAKNTARLAYRMIRDGCIMKITKTIQGPDSAKHAKNTMVARAAAVNSGSTQAPSGPAFGAEPLRVNPRSKVSSSVSNAVHLQGQENTGAPKLMSSKTAPKRAICRQTGKVSHCTQTDNGRSSESRSVSKLEIDARSPPPKKNKIEPCRKFSIFQDAECGTGINKAPSTALRDTTNTMSTATKTMEGRLKTPATISKVNSTKVQGNMRSPSESGMCPSNNSSFKTPFPVSSALVQRQSSMKATPPMCTCGRRSKRKFVQSIGPNQGRSFFCCGVGKNRQTATKGCSFFKWEPENQNIHTSPVLASGSVANYFVRCSNVEAMNKVQSIRAGSRLPQPDFSTPQPGNRMKCGYQAGAKKTLGLKVLGNSSVRAVVSKV